jgi:hypothetical protein
MRMIPWQTGALFSGVSRIACCVQSAATYRLIFIAS